MMLDPTTYQGLADDADASLVPANPVNRRVFERFVLNPGYTGAGVGLHPDEAGYPRPGHVYDISEGGICFELDEPLETGVSVSMRIELPSNCADPGPDGTVLVTGNIVWCDLDEPGPARMALAITRFERAGDKHRLMRALTSKRYLRAA